MKENILDILMYLFENYMDEDVQLNYDQQSLEAELMKVGFTKQDISKAFNWLEGLTTQQPMLPTQGISSIRIYSSLECDKLDIKCRGFLVFLEQIGVLDATSRELVIDRAMALDTEDFDLEQLKWVILMVLLNQPGKEAAFAWMENFINDEMREHLH